MKTAAVTSWQTFPPETLDALFEAVELDDVIDGHVELPDAAAPCYTGDTMQACFALCWQFWRRGVTRQALLRLVDMAICTGDLSAVERIQFKHMRAAYKQLRCALMLYATRHEEPIVFRITVRALGRLQDACRLDRRVQVRSYGLVLRILLSRPFWNIAKHRVGATRIDTAKGCAAFRRQEVSRLRQLLRQPHFSGREFHVIRKVISRQVSFYDVLRSLESNAHACKMSRYLSAINGLMGARHDAMLKQDVSGARGYATCEPLPLDLRARLEAWVARFPV